MIRLKLAVDDLLLPYPHLIVHQTCFFESIAESCELVSQVLQCLLVQNALSRRGLLSRLQSPCVV